MPSAPLGQNHLLSRLPPAEYQRLAARMKPVELEFKQVVHKFREPINYVYFPIHGAASAVTVMADGSTIEIATIGNEGVVGHSILEGNDDASLYDIIIQVAGDAWRMDATVLREEGKKGPLRELLARYNKAFIMQLAQSVGCNGLHSAQARCCRWLLITLDRMETNVVPVTHEFMGIMLGVRRATVTDVLIPLHEQGLVNNTRGMITILDRPGLEKLSCECYRRVKSEFDRLMG